MSRKKVVTIFNKNRKLSKNRRTSLNVNLSYTSSASSSGEDETNGFSTICEKDVDASVVDESPHLPTKRYLSTKRSLSGKLAAVNKIDSEIARVKPSVVRIIRLSTSTPIAAHRNGDRFRERPSDQILEPSENTRRSSALQNVRFPLDGEIFSPEARTIVMETSMDITDVQGGMILNSEPVTSERAVINRRDNSFEVIRDTDSLRSEVDQRMPSVIIPESDQDSINTVRTSLNVNTSLDSRFSSMPNESLYDPKGSRVGDASKDVQVHEGNALEGILSYPNSESSDGNSMANTIIITRAVIEQDRSTDRDYQRLIEDETTLDLDSEKESHFLYNTSMTKRKNETSSTDQLTLKTDTDRNHLDGTMATSKQPVSRPEPNHLNSDSTNDSCSTSESLRLRLSNEENDNAARIIPDDVSSQPTKKKKKKLFGLRRSELVELSPVSVQMPDKRRVSIKKRKNWSKPAKRILNDLRVVAGKASTPVDSLSEDDFGGVDPSPRKQKRIRRVKTKKIVIKKMADISLWNRMNGNNTVANETCEDISSALRRTSLDDFAPTKKLVGRRNRRSRPKIIIVATGLPIEEKLLVKSAVTALGSAKLEKIVTRYTTHVVSKGIRTVNLLRGIVRGCWLVSFDWISKSRDHGGWINPEKYEITSLFPKAVQDNRKEKQLFGAAYVSELFLTCGLIHIKEETSTPPQVLKELVRIAGGRVASNPEEAKIIIGRGGLKEVWILDSITNGELQPIEQYCKKKNGHISGGSQLPISQKK